MLGADREVGGAGAEDHDPARAALDHPGEDGAAAQIGAEDVDLEDVPPVARRDVERRAVGGRDAGVRDEQVDPVVGLLGRADHARDVVRVADVADERDRVELLGGLLDLLAGARADGHLRAGACELARDREPDPAAAAGYERNRAGEVVACHRRA